MAPVLFHKQLRHLEAMLESGVPLDSGCRALAEDRTPGDDRRFWESLATQFEAGEPIHRTLSNAFPQLPSWVPDCVQAGEEAGQSAFMIRQVAEILEVSHRWRRSLARRLAYPLLIVHLAALLPSLPLWVQYGTAIALLWIAGVLALLYLPAALGFFLYRAIQKYPGIHEKFSRVISGWPVVGLCWRLPAGSRFLAVLGVQAGAGVRWEEAMQHAATASGFPLLENRARQFSARMEEGESITGFLAELKFFPSEIINEVRTGELTGRSDRSLLHSTARCSEMAEEQLRVLGIAATVLAYLVAVTLILAAGAVILGPVYWQVYQLL